LREETVVIGIGTPRILRLGALSALLVCALALGSSAPAGAASVTARGSSVGQYRVLAWNDLGMHCYNGSFADMLVLPPYNTVWAQVLRVDDPPSIVTTGVVVTYEFPGNTYSAGKTDFWDYATQLFAMSTPLEPNVGLAGKGPTGTLDPVGDHFTAVGVPLTEYSDADTATRQPLQTAIITVRDASSGAVLTSATVVTPVSSELNCVMCHADDGDATTRYPITPTGDFQANILALHDYLSASKYPAGHTGALLDRRPVMCAECHADAALGAPGLPGISSLSNAMHRHHNPTNAPDITPDTNGCYSCHPGMDTQCLRCVMSQRYGMGCVDCHGDIVQVAKNPSPWANEPKCAAARCHGAAYATDQPLYRNSKGHGGLYCAACHDSPHAIAVSREASDAIKFVELQGSDGTLRVCTVCHATTPTGAFSHVTTSSMSLAYLTMPAAHTHGHTVTISGALLPMHAAGAHTVQTRLYRKRGHSWVVVRTYWTTNSARSTYTRYSATFRLSRGSYRIRAMAAADADHLSSGWSAYRYFSVR
jgi:hypothetical protein